MFGNLPDDFILSTAEAAAFDRISVDTFKRREKRGEGPPRVQLSLRRHGYRVGALRARRAEPETAPSMPSGIRISV
jgi:hypothetical protein